MPYSTDRGVTTYSDRDTPPEFATGQDEERARYNHARDVACDAADRLAPLLDALYEPTTGDIHDAATRLDLMGALLLAMVAEAEHLLGRAALTASAAS